MQTAPLSDQCISVILGSLLGDGSLALDKRYKNARFSFKHSISQKDYFFWKVGLLTEISGDKNHWYQGLKTGVDGWGGPKLRFQSRALDQLTKLYNLTTQRGKKVVKRKWLNLMTPLALAIWWLDDGSLVANSRKGVFCTDGFSLKENMILKRYLSVVWGINVTLAQSSAKRHAGNRYYRLYVRSTEQLQDFLSIILPFVKVESMLPKVLLLYKDSQLQERWISKVAELTGFSQDIVQKHVLAKKSKYKAYRE